MKKREERREQFDGIGIVQYNLDIYMYMCTPHYCMYAYVSGSLSLQQFLSETGFLSTEQVQKPEEALMDQSLLGLLTYVYTYIHMYIHMYICTYVQITYSTDIKYQISNIARTLHISTVQPKPLVSPTLIPKRAQ